MRGSFYESKRQFLGDIETMWDEKIRTVLRVPLASAFKSFRSFQIDLNRLRDTHMRQKKFVRREFLVEALLENINETIKRIASL